MNAELTLLRDFYSAWVALHTIPRSMGNRRRQEEAAQALVDCAHRVANFDGSRHAEQQHAAEVANDG